MCLEKVVVDSFDSCIIILALSFFGGNGISEPIDFILIEIFLISEFC